ncbi:DNA-directed RNA polymerase III subunit RPC4 like protein [Aduncisulcus paluster]|uniref:DNA-directed RNA polymerase III subunit RPC4 like protein n=1 Tax=Aduncisulcus paluster TaxID=2918883 RepID=A0ABQ5JTZ2_9EUKA|nr:DNA-directed RNA polymerase III subunit RPC4 like protein [Aduncisulcus paluster]
MEGFKSKFKPNIKKAKKKRVSNLALQRKASLKEEKERLEFQASKERRGDRRPKIMTRSEILSQIDKVGDVGGDDDHNSSVQDRVDGEAALLEAEQGDGEIEGTGVFVSSSSQVLPTSLPFKMPSSKILSESALLGESIGEMELYDEKDKESRKGKKEVPYLENLRKTELASQSPKFVKGLHKDKFVLVQLPPLLPFQKSREPSLLTRKAAHSGQLARGPECKLGKMRIHRDGHVSFDFGGVPFLAFDGSSSGCAEEFVVCDGEKKQSVSFGVPKQKVLMIPDLAKIAEGKEIYQ